MLLARSDFGGEFVPSPGHGDPIRPPEPLHFSGLLPWKICLTILHCCGISSSLFRILHRFFSRSAWWDDYVAIVPFVAEILHCAMLWMFKNQGVGPISRKPFSFWLSTVVYLLQLWSSRVCLALSLARVIPDGQLTRKLAFHIAAAFALGGAGMLVGRVAACVPRTESGSAKQSAQCIMHSGLAIAGFTVDIIADLVLVACALISLWNVKLPKNERRLILSVFSASALTCIVAIVYMMLVLSPLNRPPMGPIYMAMMPHIEAAVSVVVCNLSVVVTFFYRTCRRYNREKRIRHLARFIASSTTGSSFPSRYTPTSIISLSGNADFIQGGDVFPSTGVSSIRTCTRISFAEMSEPEWCESGIGYEDEDENEWHGSRARVEVVEKDERGLVDEGGLVVPDLGSQKASIAFEKGAHVQPECGRRSSEVPEMDSQRLDSQTSAEKSACQQRAQEFDDTSGVT